MFSSMSIASPPFVLLFSYYIRTRMNGTDVVMGWNQITALGNLPWGQLKKVLTPDVVEVLNKYGVGE